MLCVSSFLSPPQKCKLLRRSWHLITAQNETFLVAAILYCFAYPQDRRWLANHVGASFTVHIESLDSPLTPTHLSTTSEALSATMPAKTPPSLIIMHSAECQSILNIALPNATVTSVKSVVRRPVLQLWGKGFMHTLRRHSVWTLPP